MGHKKSVRAVELVVNNSIFEEVDQTFEKRRMIRRTLPDFVGVYAEGEDGKLWEARLSDISAKGISFDCPTSTRCFSIGETVSLRIYFNKRDFLNVSIEISNSRETKSKKSRRYGAKFLKLSQQSQAIMHEFTRFLRVVAHLLGTENEEQKAA